MILANLAWWMAAWLQILARESVFAALVFCVVLAGVRLLRRRGPAVRVVLWSLVFVRLLLPASSRSPPSTMKSRQGRGQS